LPQSHDAVLHPWNAVYDRIRIRQMQIPNQRLDGIEVRSEWACPGGEGPHPGRTRFAVRGAGDIDFQFQLEYRSAVRTPE
jgi:hypothetical protein